MELARGLAFLREESAISPTASCTRSFKPESKVPVHVSLLILFNVRLLTVRSILSTLGYLKRLLERTVTLQMTNGSADD